MRLIPEMNLCRAFRNAPLLFKNTCTKPPALGTILRPIVSLGTVCRAAPPSCLTATLPRVFSTRANGTSPGPSIVASAAPVQPSAVAPDQEAPAGAPAAAELAPAGAPAAAELAPAGAPAAAELAPGTAAAAPELTLVSKPLHALEAVGEAGIARGQRPLSDIFKSSVMGSVYLSFGCALYVVVAGGSVELAQSLPGLHRLVSSLVFPVGLVMITFTGTDLLTTNFMYHAMPFLSHRHRNVRADLMLNVWAVSGVGNLVGSVAMAAFFGKVEERKRDMGR